MDTFKKFIKHDSVQWIGISLIVSIIVEILNQRSIIKMIVFIASRPLMFLLGFLMTMVVIGIGFMFRKRVFTVALMVTVVMALAISGFVVLSMRVTPFTFGDFFALKEGVQVVNKYMPGYGVPLIIAVIVIAIIGLIILGIKSKKYEASSPLYKRIIAEVVILFLTLLLNEGLHMAGSIPKKFTSLPNAYKQYGFTVCYAYSIFDNGISKPGKYDEETMDKIVQNLLEQLKKQGYDVDKYFPKPTSPNTTNAVTPTVSPVVTQPVSSTPLPTEPTPQPTDKPQEDDRRPNIIFVQLESFFDLTTVDGLKFSTDPLPNLHWLMNEYTSGNLNVPVIGAGTCNTGFEVITGFCIDWFGAGEYPYKTILQNSTCESMCYDSFSYGYRTHAIHNNASNFYGRDVVFPKLGFETFTAIEHMEDMAFTETGWAKDSVLIPNILNAMKTTEEPDVIYTISVQGHGSYPDADILDNKHLTVTGSGSEETDNQYTYYANQIYEMDQFIRNLVDSVNASGEKSLIVFFGDHLPNLGIEEESLGGKSLYQTPLLIWDNIGLERNEIDLEAFQLYSYVYKKLGMYEGMVNLCHQAYFDSLLQAGGCTLPDEIEEDTVYYDYTEQLHYLEYDLIGPRPSYFAWGGENPFKEVDMKFGDVQPTIDRVTFVDDVLYVYGSHFTEYSVLFADDEYTDTEYVSSHLIKVRGIEPENGMSIFVAQYRSADKTILSRGASKTLNIVVNILLQN